MSARSPRTGVADALRGPGRRVRRSRDIATFAGCRTARPVRQPFADRRIHLREEETCRVRPGPGPRRRVPRRRLRSHGAPPAASRSARTALRPRPAAFHLPIRFALVGAVTESGGPCRPRSPPIRPSPAPFSSRPAPLSGSVGGRGRRRTETFTTEGVEVAQERSPVRRPVGSEPPQTSYLQKKRPDNEKRSQ